MGAGFHINLYAENGFVDQVAFRRGHTVTDAQTGRGYRIVGAARQGGNGVVFRADEVDSAGTSIGKCAVKVLKRLDPVRLDRFQNEVRVHSALGHARIARLHGSGTDTFGGRKRSLPWVAMDLGGPNLREYQDKYGRLDIQTAVRLSVEAAEAIEHLHLHQLIHRDIKPANFVWSDDARVHVLMIDFGLAKYTGEDVSTRDLDQFTMKGEFVGPQNWMSPELLAYARDKKWPVEQASDLFQLGLLIWYFATDTVLAGIPSRALDPTGGAIHSLVSDLCQQEPSDRPPSATEIITRLKDIEASLAS